VVLLVGSHVFRSRLTGWEERSEWGLRGGGTERERERGRGRARARARARDTVKRKRETMAGMDLTLLKVESLVFCGLPPCCLLLLPLLCPKLATCCGERKGLDRERAKKSEREEQGRGRETHQIWREEWLRENKQ
jgi:hypothetical protein